MTGIPPCLAPFFPGDTLLAANSPNVVSRATILDRVWGESPEIHPNIVDVYIGYLRRKLGDKGGNVIRTVRGFGYQIQAPDNHGA